MADSLMLVEPQVSSGQIPAPVTVADALFTTLASLFRLPNMPKVELDLDRRPPGETRPVDE